MLIRDLITEFSFVEHLLRLFSLSPEALYRESLGKQRKYFSMCWLYGKEAHLYWVFHHVSFDKRVSKIRIEREILIRLKWKDKVLLLLQSDIPINHTHIKELVGNSDKKQAGSLKCEDMCHVHFSTLYFTVSFV